MEIKQTNRGFDYTEFKDDYGGECSLQKSSSAMVDRIWFGVNDVKPKIMVSDAKRLGLDTKGKVNGWMDYEVPKEVLFHDRMHLNQDIIHDLMPYLTEFEDTGDLEDGYGYEYTWCNQKYLDENGYALSDYISMLEDFEKDIDRLNRTLTRMEERKKKIMTQLKTIKSTMTNLKEIQSQKEKEIMEWYMKGYNDEKKGTSSVMDCSEYLESMYKWGAEDASDGHEPMTIEEIRRS